jgi:colanic acid biosynthesis glycosyl transferase WcaI
MSRILVTGINYAPEYVGTGKYTGEMCEWLAARGHRVRVVTAPPYYPAWKVWPGFSRLWFRRENHRNLSIIRCPLWVPKQPHGLTRILHLASFALSSILAMVYSAFWRPEIVISIAPTLTGAPAAWLLARVTGARCWLHIQDFEVDAAMDMGIVEAGPFKRLALAAERLLLGRFDAVSTISARMLARLGSKGVVTERQVLLPNWVDIDAIRPLDGPSVYRRELGIPDDAVVALYSGNMGLKQGLELIGEAALQLADEPGLCFVLGGEGPARSQLEQLCGGLPNVKFMDLQPAARLCDWLGLADIHLLPQRADVADLVMPSKLTGMLASGRAVLATALPDTAVAEAVRDSGVFTAPGDTCAFVAALRQLTHDHALRVRLGMAARKQAESTLAREGILLNLEHLLAQLIGDSSPTKSADQLTNTVAETNPP